MSIEWKCQQVIYCSVFGRPFVKRFTLCYRIDVLSVCTFGVGLLWPNGWMDQDATWYGSRPLPRRDCVRWGSSSTHTGRSTAVPPLFGPCLLWRLDDQDTSYGRRPRPRRHCVMGTQLPCPQRKGAQQPPILSPYLLWPTGWMDEDATWYGSRPRPRRHCVRWEPSSPIGTQLTPTERGTAAPHFSVHFALARSPISATADLLLKRACLYLSYRLFRLGAAAADERSM